MQIPASQPGIHIALGELIDMRHKVHEVPLFSTPARRSPLIGLHHSKLRGRGVDFDQVRVYQPGDDVRTIDWRVTARTQEPHTKLFHEERERPIFIIAEQSQRLFFGSGLCFKSVLAARAAALIDRLGAEGGEPVLCVSHCDVIRGVVAHALGLSLDNILRFEIAPASISWVMAHGQGRAHVLTLNGND